MCNEENRKLKLIIAEVITSSCLEDYELTNLREVGFFKL